jgi:Recombinase zinc beta ribbon domain
LENPRYTGYAFFGRWTKQETLIDPDDVAAGHVVRFRRSAPDRVVRSRRPAHPQIVPVEVFTEVQLRRRARAAGGLAGSRKLERGPKETKWIYALRGAVRCGICRRRMEGTPRQSRIYYRCAARGIVPGSPVVDRHPKNVYLPERAVLDEVNGWLGGVVRAGEPGRDRAAIARRDHLGQRCREKRADPAQVEGCRDPASAAPGRNRSGADPAALVEGINRAKAERDAARTELDRLPAARKLGQAEIDVMIDYLTEVGRDLNDATPAKLQELYAGLRLEMIYHPKEQAVDVTIRPGGRDGGRDSERVRGGLAH